MADVKSTLDALIESVLAQYPTLYDIFDPEMRSLCTVGEPFSHDDLEVIRWVPHRRRRAEDFGGLENALEVEIHPDIKAYYGNHWSGCIETEHKEGHVSLIFLWNTLDVDRLVENLIGHALAQKQSRSPFSVFFACTEPNSELFLAINNASGEVQLEKPGYKPIRVVAPNLTEFLSELQPAAPWLHPTREGLKDLFTDYSLT